MPTQSHPGHPHIDAVSAAASIDMNFEVRSTSNFLCIQSTAPARRRHARFLPICSIICKSEPNTFTPTCVRIPVDNMSCGFESAAPDIRYAGQQFQSRRQDVVFGQTRRPLIFRFEGNIVSLMLIGAGSVDVSARPIFPTTVSTAGS